MAQFYGTVTIDNIEKIAQMIDEKLTGKKYVFTSWNEGMSEQASLHVQPNQELKDSIKGNYYSLWYDNENDYPEYAGFNFSDTYGVWGLSTSKHSSDLKFGWDSSYNAPYIVFDYNEIKIIHRAPAGHILVWVISIQE